VRTLHRRRDPQRESHITLVVATQLGENIEPDDIVMLEGLGACLVLSARKAAHEQAVLQAQEQAFELEVETLAYGNLAPDLP
jgi:hypothetical protein